MRNENFLGAKTCLAFVKNARRVPPSMKGQILSEKKGAEQEKREPVASDGRSTGRRHLPRLITKVPGIKNRDA